jgi:hypothetical protein
MPGKAIKKTKGSRSIVAKKDQNDVNNFIAQAIAVNAPIETMERLFVLQKEFKAEKAKEAFVRAKAALQAEIPIIEKKKVVKGKDGQIRYKYAPLEDELAQKNEDGKTVKQLIGEHGFSYSFREVVTPDSITAICILTHIEGHSEESPFTVDIGSEAFMTDVQKRGARMTFAKRYAFNNALGLITGDEDTDGTETDKENEPKSEKAKIVRDLNALGFKNLSGENLIAKIKALTNLDPKDEKNLPDIVDLLGALVQEKREQDQNNADDKNEDLGI